MLQGSQCRPCLPNLMVLQVFMTCEDHQKDIVDPAVKGTKNVLEAVIKAKSVRRVVLTSSTAGEADLPTSGLKRPSVLLNAQEASTWLNELLAVSGVLANRFHAI